MYRTGINLGGYAWVKILAWLVEIFALFSIVAMFYFALTRIGEVVFVSIVMIAIHMILHTYDNSHAETGF